MRFLLFFLFLTTQILANSHITIVTENEPSSLVEGVSVITGDFCMRTPIYTAQGAEPIHLSNSYISEEICLTGYEHTTAVLNPRIHTVYIQEPYGTVVNYFWDDYKKKRKSEKDQKKSYVLTTNRFIYNAQGITNTASGDLSARTHLKNQRIVFDPKIDSKGKTFIFHASDGAIRLYGGAKEISAIEIPHSGAFTNEKECTGVKYFLMREELPNGHVLQYFWNRDAIYEIRATNKSGKKIFSTILLKKANAGCIEYIGSDGQRGVLHTTFFQQGKKSVFEKISSPDHPDISFCWAAKQMMIGDATQQKAYLTSFFSEEKKPFSIHYYMGDKHTKPKVSHLEAPVGKDCSLFTTHRFVYQKDSTDVFDIDGNKTTYLWNEKSQLTSIRRFIGSEMLYSEERFVWDGTLLASRSFWDANGVCRSAHSFIYDGHGNVIENFFCGNLTGEGGPVILKPNGRVDERQTQTVCTKTSYSQDNKHLPLRVEDANGLVTIYTYVSGTNLVKTKTLCDREVPKIIYTYEYDEDFLLIEERLDDGICQKIKKITPKQTQPFLGMPEIIEEKYIDGGEEKLLRKKVLYYRAGARIDHEDIYDAEDNFCYQLSYEYDEKNRITRETNPLGQASFAKYDISANRCFYQGFGSAVEETFAYDFSNRPVRKILKDSEKERVFEYSYDTKHRLEWESDERGHKTHYKYDFLGRCIEMIEPPLADEQGDLVCPVTKKDYDIFGNETLRIDPNGFEIKTEYNSYGKPIHITYPDGTAEYFTYTLKGDLKSHISPSGIETIYEYDYLGRVVQKSVFEQAALLSQENFFYTGYLLTGHIDPEGHSTCYEYDGAGRKIREIFAGETVHYKYDALGRVSQIEEGEEITYKLYDLLDRVIEERKETLFGQIVQKVLYGYNEQGDQTETTRFINGRSATEICRYDSFHRLIQKMDALGHIETMSYQDVLDDHGQKVLQKTHVDALGLETIETFDPQGNLCQIEKRKDKTLSLIRRFYTPTKKLSLQIDTVFNPDGSRRDIFTRWEYDSMGRETAIIEASGAPEEKITRKTYTPTGELKTVTKPDQTVIFYGYNSLKHLTSIDSSDGTVHHQMSYNRLGHLQTTDQIKRTTDPKGKVLSETFFSKYAVENRFNEQGRRTSFEIPSLDVRIVYTYLGNALAKIARFNHLEELYSHEYLERDFSRKILSERLIDGRTIKTQMFDRLCRKIATTSPYFHQTIDNFDPIGNITSMTRGDVRTYRYDPLYQLIEETGRFSHNYSYDSGYNRLTKDQEKYEINDLHQATSHLAYNLNGCPIQKKNLTFTYDALDRLIEIASSNYFERFTYDSEHRCLSKTISRSDKQTTQYFLYDGQKEIGSLDENFQLKELRVLGDTPHAELGAAIAIELKGEVFIPLHDLQNNLAVLVDLKGSIVSQSDYNAFGEEVLYGPIASPWGFSSKRRSRSTGLVYYGRRCYLPELGRWLTPDPAGFTDGMNLYAFVKNEPLMHFDEYGLWLKPRPPGTFNASNAINQWKYDASRTWNHPKFQGSLQMAGGFAEMSIGAGLAYSPFSPIGAAMFLHGADHFVAGACAFGSGRQTQTLSENLLQRAGMTSSQAAFTNNVLSMGASFGTIGLRNHLVHATNQFMAQRAMSSFKPVENIQELQATKTILARDIVPVNFFKRKTYAEIEGLFIKKFGPPRGVGPYNKSFYNLKTQRTFNLHMDPLHHNGKPHVDIRRRGLPSDYYDPFFLKESHELQK